MKRVNFIASSGAATAGVFAPHAQRSPKPATTGTPAPRIGPRTILAPRLRPGNKIGIVALAGPARSQKELQRARLHVEMLGLKPVFGDHVTRRIGYLAGSDEDRAADFNRFARDRDIRGIFALRGGYGAMRILDKIDYEALSGDPKVVLGFSDITALLNAITVFTGLVTFHGPVPAHDDFPSDVIEWMRRAMMRNQPLGGLHVPGMRSIARGVARGKLAGGNLSIVAALSGGPFAVPCDGRVLILEDVREAPYRIDRMLTTLRINRDLARVAAVGLGAFPLCVPGPGDDNPSQTLDEVLDERFFDIQKPVIRGLSVGHVQHQWTLPLGALATVDADAGTFSVDEPAVL